jgi:hypothetical protein
LDEECSCRSWLPHLGRVSASRVAPSLRTATAEKHWQLWHTPPMPARSSGRPLKRPRDPIALAKLIGDIATGQVEDKVEDTRNPAAVALGRLGGMKGGKARAAKLSAKKRSEIARKAAASRWARRS